MKRNLVILLTVVAALIGAEAANAHSRSWRIHHRQAIQRARFRAAWGYGHLTVHERIRLARAQARIRHLERYARREALLSYRERRIIVRAERHQSRVLRRLSRSDRVY